MAIFHATVVTRRSDRRIGGHVGERHNLCGADCTLQDQLIRDFKNGWAAEGWERCADCAKIIAAKASLFMGYR